LEQENSFGYYELIDPEIWTGFKRNTIIEGIGSFRFSKMEEMVGLIDQFSTLAGVMETATGKTPIDESASEAIKGFKALEKTQQGKGIPTVFSFINSPEYKFVSYLNPIYLKVPKEQMIGEINIFCKVQRILAKNEKIELVDLIPNLKNLNLNRNQRRNLPKNTSAPPEIKDTIKGPAAVVIPIAIYR
jgi:hypothetical protein